MNNKILLTGLVLASLTTGNVFAEGLVYGYNNVSNGNYGSVIGSNNIAEATATSSMTLGDGNTTKMPNSLTFGQGNVNNGENSFVGGDKAKAVGRDTFAFGSSAEALTEYTIAIGSQARTIGYNTLAIGNGATVSGPSSIAIGRTNNVTGENSVAIGANNGTIKGEQAIVVGYNNKMTTADQEQLIFGSNSVTSGQGSIVVGTHGQATAIDTVALGNNTIADVQNGVAIGTNSVTESAVGTSNIKDNTTDIRFSNSTYAGSTPDSVVSFGTNGRAGAGGVTSYTRQLQNVSAGRVSSTSTDAINGSQLYDVALEAQKYNTMVNGFNTTVVATDNAYGRKEFKVNVNKDLVDMNSAAFGKNTDDKHTVVNTDGTIVFDGDKDTKYGANGLTIEDRNNLDTASYNINGMTASDANGTVSFTTTNIDAGNNQIHNVKAGTAGTDAVNVDQMNKAIEANKAVESVVADNQVDNIAAVRVTNGKSTGDANAQYGVYVSRSTVDAIAKASNRFAGDDVINVTRWDAPANVADLTTFKYNGEKAATKTPLTYKANGKDAKQVMLSNGLDFTNGKNTTATTDANGVVKYSVNDNLNGMKSVNFDGGTTVNNDGLTINNGPSVTKDGINAGNKTITNVAAGQNDTDAVNVSQLNNAKDQLTGRINGLDQRVTTNAADIRTVNHTLGDHEGRITVLEGNVQALDNKINTTANNVLNQSKSYTDNQAAKVGANAAALSALHPLDFNADEKWQFSVGFGNYKGKNATALGAFYQPNENVLLSVGTTLGTGENMINASATVRFGSHSSMTTNKQVAVAKEVQDLKLQLSAISQKYDNLVKNLSAQKAGQDVDFEYSDLPKDHWAYDFVKKLSDKGYLNGYPDGTFKGDTKMTRYEFAAALWRAVNNGAIIDAQMAKAIKEFEPELEEVNKIMRYRIDTVAGKDNSVHKTERLRVNKNNDPFTHMKRDDYGTKTYTNK